MNTLLLLFGRLNSSNPPGLNPYRLFAMSTTCCTLPGVPHGWLDEPLAE
jgi:hypothetical protein